MKKNLSNSQISQVAPEQKIIEIANNCANKVWGGSWNHIIKVVNLERGCVTIKLCDGNSRMYSIRIEGGAVVAVNLHNQISSLTLHDLWFINEIDGQSNEIDTISGDVA